MIINRENYELYIVDFAEGNLSPDLAIEMQRFIQANSDIKEELEMFLEVPIVDKSIMYDRKDQLKKIPFQKTDKSSEYFQNQCVAFVEGIMPANELDLFIELVESDEEKRKELNFFRNTKLQNEAFIYNEKILLKRDESNHQIHEKNFEEYCVACVEGWLNQTGLIALNNFIVNNPEKKSVLELYNKIKVLPDLSISYPNKSALKKHRILSLKTRKAFSYAASVAAVFVFGTMLFYTTKLDSPTALTSVMVEPTQEAKTTSIENKIEVFEVTEKEESKIVLLKDPFGFKNVHVSSVNQSQLQEKAERVAVTRIDPIKVSELHCEPCDVFEHARNISIKKQVVNKLEQENNTNKAETIANAASNNNVLWNITQAGISGLNRITNTKINLEKEEETKRTKIEFQSKYFAFSTNVKQRNSY